MGGCVRAICNDSDVIALGEHVHKAREQQTGRLWVLEANPHGGVWHLSSTLAKTPEHTHELYAQFDALVRAADLLIQKTRAETSMGLRRGGISAGAPKNHACIRHWRDFDPVANDADHLRQDRPPSVLERPGLHLKDGKPSRTKEQKAYDKALDRVYRSTLKDILSKRNRPRGAIKAFIVSVPPPRGSISLAAEALENRHPADHSAAWCYYSISVIASKTW